MKVKIINITILILSASASCTLITRFVFLGTLMIDGNIYSLDSWNASQPDNLSFALLKLILGFFIALILAMSQKYHLSVIITRKEQIYITLSLITGTVLGLALAIALILASDIVARLSLYLLMVFFH